MYHSSATLLLDGSVLVSGSNPNADCKLRGVPAGSCGGSRSDVASPLGPPFVAADVNKTTNPTYTYVTQYQVEILYPD
jgi:hypothetical protein